MKNVLVLGANGMLGYTLGIYFKKSGYKTTLLTRNEFDIANDSFEKFQELAHNADVVINCAGVIKSLIPNISEKVVMKVNADFPNQLAKFCEQKSIPCIHITSDCVYNGLKGNYSEKDSSDAFDLYGKSKAAGDTNHCMTLRTSIIGEERRNGHRCLLEWVRSNANKEVQGYTNHIWNGVTTLYLAEIIKGILEKNLYQKGIFHIHTPKTITKAGLLKLISDIYELNLKIKLVETDPKCDRSMTSVYDLSKRLCTKSFETQIRELKGFFKQLD